MDGAMSSIYSWESAGVKHMRKSGWLNARQINLEPYILDPIPYTLDPTP